MRSHPNSQKTNTTHSNTGKRKRVLHFVQRVVHSLLSAIVGWGATGVVVLLLGTLIGDPLSTTLTTLVIALQITLILWCLVGIPIALSFSKQAVRHRDDVIDRHVIATTSSFAIFTLVLLVILLAQAPEYAFVTIIFFFPAMLWAAAIGWVGGLVFWALQQKFAR